MSTLIYNANIYVQRDVFAQALLVGDDGKIAAVGTEEEVLPARATKICTMLKAARLFRVLMTRTNTSLTRVSRWLPYDFKVLLPSQK